MKKIMAALGLIVGLVLGAQAHAGLLLEPYLGYHMGKINYTGGGDDTISGVSFGGRIGYQSLGFMAGVDASTGKLTIDSDPSRDGTPTDIGVFAGYEFPIMLRVYAAYMLSSEMKQSDNFATYKGDGGIKLGVGFTALPFVSVNLEYITQKYDKYGAAPADADTKMYGLTVSLPFDL